MAAMIRTVIDADALQAFVDGELSPEEAARVVLHLADSPRDQAYVDALMETDALLAAAYADPMHQALPEKLRATIFPEPGPQQAAPAGARRPGWRGVAASRVRVLAAIAACAVAAAGVGAALLPRGPDGGGDRAIKGQLASVLDGQASYAAVSDADGNEFMVKATYVDREGRPCREYEILRAGAGKMVEGIACRTSDAAWANEIVVASRLDGAAAADGGYVPASGPGDEALDAVLQRLGIGQDALGAAEEAARIEGGWTP